MTHIVVSGSIGAGKTTAARLIATHRHLTLYEEDFAANTFLERFYADQPRWALASQLFFLRQTVDHHIHAQSRGGVQDHSPQEVHLGFDAVLLDRRVLAKDEFHLLDNVYWLLASTLKPPDLVVYLDAQPSELRHRIDRRGRPYETALDETFLVDLSAAKRKSWEKQANESNQTVLWLDTDQNNLTEPEGAATLLAKVDNILGRPHPSKHRP